MMGLSVQSKLTLLIICSAFTSCATLFNKEGTSSTFYTQSPSRIVVNKDTVQTQENSVHVLLKRSADPLEITVITDTSERKVMIRSRNSLAYWMNIYHYGLGFFVDHNSPKRYNYPSKIYLNPADTLKEYSIFGEANNKGDAFLHLSIPYVNSFLLTPDGESRKASTGFMGLSVGLDYYHRKKQFLNFSASGVMDFLAPIPAPVHYGGVREHFSSAFITVSNNHKMKRFSAGYGVSYSRNRWNFRNHGNEQMEIYPPIIIESKVKKNDALGLVLSSYFQTGQYFNIGVVYRPTFIRLNTLPIDRYQYEQLISLDLAWKLILKR